MKIIDDMSNFVLDAVRVDQVKMFETYIERFEQNNKGNPFLYLASTWLNFTGIPICKKNGYAAAVSAFEKWVRDPVEAVKEEEPVEEISEENPKNTISAGEEDAWLDQHRLVKYKDCQPGDLLYHRDWGVDSIVACTYVGNGYAKLESGAMVRSTVYRKRKEGEVTIHVID